jgi:predicted dehydrogenase|tara:strand:- start:1639 stop:2997 length:1359 start_codon:yes stop_codon:yes gene_type:complete
VAVDKEMNMSDSTDRRQFLKTTASTTAAAAAGITGAHAAGKPQSQTVRLGIIGCGGIMGHHVRGLVQRRENVHFSWLCDVDPAQMDAKQAIIGKFQDKPARRTKKFEDVLDDANVDAVIIATPHHWHAPIALPALAQGKDVYVEKPLSHVFNEGPMVIQAAKQHGRIVQQGSQMRSSAVTAKAERLLKDGLIGEVMVARAWTAETRSVTKPVADSKPPAGVDYERWLGPAPSRPFNRHRFHVSWRRFKDYANGEIGDDGIHDIDMARWGLGNSLLPNKVSAGGGTMILHGHSTEYPDNMVVRYEFPDGKVMVYENYPFTAYGMHGFDNGNVFYGTKGYMVFSRRGAFSTFLGPKSQRGPTEGKELRGQRGYAEHMDNFLTAVRTRRPITRANAEAAHLSCALVHFGNIAYDTNSTLDFNAKSGRFVDNPAADKLLGKSYREPYGLPALAKSS